MASHARDYTPPSVVILVEMKRRSTAITSALTAAVVIMTSVATTSIAVAQTPTQPPSASPPLTPAPPPLTQAQPAQAPQQPQAAVIAQASTPNTAAPAPGMVRMRFRTLRDRWRARVFVRTVSGTFVFVCTTPCTADLPPGAELRTTLGEEDEDPRDFAVPNDLGADVDVEVKPASKGGLVGGIIMTSIGGIFLLIGTILTAAANDARSSTGERALVTGGVVCLVIGAGLAIPGILLIANRSREPRVRTDPHRRGHDYSREDTLLMDVANARRLEPTTGLVPVAITPLRFGFSF